MAARDDQGSGLSAITIGAALCGSAVVWLIIALLGARL
jgi:hypothetical protein